MNFSLFFNENANKNVRVTMTDGEFFEGQLHTYISEVDNYPDPESIVVSSIELFTNEIKEISII
jgi:hypothetical protein